MDEYFLDLSIQLSTYTLTLNEVPIACIITYQNIPISFAYNQTNELSNPLAHAEIIAIRKINFDFLKKNFYYQNNTINELEKLLNVTIKTERNTLKPLTLYVTCEPCAMCHGILRRYGVEVVYGCVNPQFGCSTIVEEAIGVLIYKEQAILNLKLFFQKTNYLAPENKRKKKNKQ